MNVSGDSRISAAEFYAALRHSHRRQAARMLLWGALLGIGVALELTVSSGDRHWGMPVIFVAAFGLLFQYARWSVLRIPAGAKAVSDAYGWSPVTFVFHDQGPYEAESRVRLVAGDRAKLDVAGMWGPADRYLQKYHRTQVWFAGDLRFGGYVLMQLGGRVLEAPGYPAPCVDPSTPEEDLRAIEAGLATADDFAADASRTDVRFTIAPASDATIPPCIELPRIHTGAQGRFAYDENGRLRPVRTQHGRVGQTTGSLRISAAGFETTRDGSSFAIPWSRLTHVVLRGDALVGVYPDSSSAPRWDPAGLRAPGLRRSVWLSAETELASVPGGLPAVAASLLQYVREAGADTRIMLPVDPAKPLTGP